MAFRSMRGDFLFSLISIYLPISLSLLIFSAQLSHSNGQETVADEMDLSRILRRAEHSRLLDTLNTLVKEEYKDQQIQSDQVPSVSFQRREVSIPEQNEKLKNLLFDGDILLSRELLEKLVSSARKRKEEGTRQRRQAFLDNLYPSSIWQNGVPYSLNPSLTRSARIGIEQAIDFWQNESCVDFFPRTSEDNYLSFIGNGDGCWSSVGRDEKQKAQPVSIGFGCSHFGVTSHELAHALGLFHEQSRYDRDSYVRLNPRAVASNLLFNFAKVGQDEMTTYSLPYDIGSVMHYSPTEFSLDKSVPTLTALDPGMQLSMGSLLGPSFIDVALINTHYRCWKKCGTVNLDCAHGGYVDSRNCSRCKCPPGFSGILCTEIAPSFSSGCGGTVEVGEDIRRFSIVIRQDSRAVRKKECVYHFQAPPGRQVLVNILNVSARCVEGCHIDMAELKMSKDYRPVGYRVCCSESRGSRLVSTTSLVPVIFTSSHETFSMQFEYTIIDGKKNRNALRAEEVTAAEEIEEKDRMLTAEHSKDPQPLSITRLATVDVL